LKTCFVPRFLGFRRALLDRRAKRRKSTPTNSRSKPQRELWEETNVRSIELIAELPGWLKYDLPEGARGRWSGRYRGQTQKWFLFRFVGPDKEIDVRHPAGGAHDAEFDDWRWERLERLPELVWCHSSAKSTRRSQPRSRRSPVPQAGEPARALTCRL
jgi:NUDIX domain